MKARTLDLIHESCETLLKRGFRGPFVVIVSPRHELAETQSITSEGFEVVVKLDEALQPDFMYVFDEETYEKRRRDNNVA